MAGHSHWARIKRKKGANDVKKGKIFSMISKQITTCARQKGGDPDMNPTLRDILEKARAENMTRDVIERAIKKGTGDLSGPVAEEIIYEGYGPAGVAFLVECFTDNKNRSAADVRRIFERGGGSLGSSGSVAWNFDVFGVAVVPAEGVDEEQLFDLVVGAGAEDLKNHGDFFEVLALPENFQPVREALAGADIAPESAELSRLPKTTVELDLKDARKVLKLVDKFEEHDDVAKVVANFEIPDELLAELAE
jgi:YebC/PmpR family DNA-binding regulatory protein